MRFQEIRHLAAALAMALALAPSPARAECVFVGGLPVDGVVPGVINLVGLTGGVPDARGEFTIIVRDQAQNLVVGCEVSIDFRDCWGIRLAEDQPWPGVSLVCEAVPEHPWPFAVVKGVTDANGTVTFRIVGGSVNFGNNTAGNPFNCATVRAGPHVLLQTSVGAFDQNGAGGVNVADLSVWLEDSFDAEYEGRSDFNGSNTINPADMSLLLGTSLGGGSSQSTATYCD